MATAKRTRLHLETLEDRQLLNAASLLADPLATVVQDSSHGDLVTQEMVQSEESMSTAWCQLSYPAVCVDDPDPYDLRIAEMADINLNVGDTFDGVIAVFEGQIPEYFNPTIHWGDGESSPGFLNQIDADHFSVSGSHTFRHGSDSVKILLYDSYYWTDPATIAIPGHVVDPDLDATNLIDRLYSDFLHRSPDAAGMAHWKQVMRQEPNGKDLVIQGILRSQEYATNEVSELYERLLGRCPDAVGLDGFVSFMQQGGSRTEVLRSIMSSPEYFRLHGSDGAQFVTALYRDVLGRAPEFPGMLGYLTALSKGVSREAIVDSVLRSAEAVSIELQGIYYQFLDRVADQHGLTSFGHALAGGATIEQVQTAVAGSNEYSALPVPSRFTGPELLVPLPDGSYHIDPPYSGYREYARFPDVVVLLPEEQPDVLYTRTE